MSYSSEQYKYMLLRRLQRHFSLDNYRDRCYTYTFFSKLLEGLSLTGEQYQNFCNVLDDELVYCAANNVNRADDITDTMIQNQQMPLINAFAAIGVQLEILKESSSGTATFTKPDGTVMYYYVTDGTNNFDINATCGQEYSYAKQAAPYYRMDGMEILNLEDVEIRKAGDACYWSYNAETQTMMITGRGTYYGVSREEQIGSGPYNTLIIGSGISGLDVVEIPSSGTDYPKTIVLLHPADYPLNVSKFFYTYTIYTTAKTIDVYTDNLVFRTLTIPSKLTINWHTLDEWEG